MSSDKYTGTQPLSLEVTVGGQTVRAPDNLTLSPGSYTVDFSPLQYYAAPAARQVQVSAGVTVFAAGVYVPVVMKIGVTPSGFNRTSIGALHGVTPVSWIDTSSGPVTINIDQVGRVNLNAGQNYTHIFSGPGSYSYQLFLTPSQGGVVGVS